MIRWLILDVETSIKNKGNPFTLGNKLCYVGYKFLHEGKSTLLNCLTDNWDKDGLVSAIREATYLVAFNAKFDCHWLENIGIDCSHLRIWDCQYAEFLFSNQLLKYPSLEESAVKYNLGHKIDVINEKYWSKGVDTIDIPPEEMLQYLDQDVFLEEKLLLEQQRLFETTEKSKWRLFQLHMEDQHSLREMERNGLLYDVEESLKREKECVKELETIDKELLEGYSHIPINFDSPDQLSAYLYGGTIEVDVRVPIGVYKTGTKAGLPRNKVVTYKYELPRLVEPLPKTELKKEGLYSTDEKVLRRLRGSKEVKKRIGLLDKRSKCEKLRGTYYEGLPKKIGEMEWSNNYLHPSYNQCVAVTGRLSSTNPNGQNMSGDVKQLCISRF